MSGVRDWGRGRGANRIGARALRKTLRSVIDCLHGAIRFIQFTIRRRANMISAQKNSDCVCITMG